MKKSLLFALATSLIATSPALANEDSGKATFSAPMIEFSADGSHRVIQLASHHIGNMSPEAMKDHSAKMEMGIKESQTYADRSLDMLVMGNQLAAEAVAKKDIKKALHAIKMLKHGQQMHRLSMHALHQIHHTLKHHLMHAKVGDYKMEGADLEKLQQAYDNLGKTMQAMHNSCSPEMAKISGHATQLTALGNELMLKAKASKNPEQMLVGAELMESAMTLTMNHHKTETRRIIKRYGADGTLATEDHSSHHE
jgi:hypothetical protein